MALLLRDSIEAPLIPTDTPVVAGYGDGKYIWSPSWKDGSNWFDLFPSSVKLVIVVSAADAGDILDVETGDATPDQVPNWCARFNRPGRRAPTIYCDRNTWPQIIDALASAGVNPAGPHVDWWIGTLDGTQTVTVPPGGKPPVAVQYIDTGAYDESIIHDPTWVGLPVADPAHSEGGEMSGLLSYPGTDAPGRFDELYKAGGHAIWGAFPGGAGGWEAFTGNLTDLGAPTPGLAEGESVSGCFTPFNGGWRLNVRGVDPTGKRWLKVMDAVSFALVQDWTQGPSTPDADVAVVAPDTTLRAYLRAGPT
jgi:hypothetical protein